MMRNDITGLNDILETISVLRSAKNFLFMVSLLAMIVLGCIFVFSRVGIIEYPWNEPPAVSSNDESCGAQQPSDGSEIPSLAAVVEQQTQEIAQEALPQAADTAQADDAENLPAQDAPQAQQSGEQDMSEQAPIEINAKKWKLEWKAAAVLIRLCNTVLVFSLTLYCFTLLVGVKITLVGRMSGVCYAVSGMFLSMAAAVFFMPWQAAFPGVGIAGAMYMPYELACAAAGFANFSSFDVMMFYARYAGLWLLVMVLLLMAQGRSMCWIAKCLDQD